MASSPADPGTDRPDRPDGSTLHIVGRSARLHLPREAIARDIELERAELELADLGPSIDLDGGPEQFRNRATTLRRIAVRMGWSAAERALSSLGPVRIRPLDEGVVFEIRYGRARAPVAVRLALGPSHGTELEVVFGPAWLFDVPEGPTVRLAERVRQALVRATGGAAPTVARGFRAAGPTSFVFDWARAALWPALPRRGLKMPDIPEDLGFELRVDEAGLRVAGDRGTPRSVPAGFAEARSRQAELHRGHDAELLLSRGRWIEAFELLTTVFEREGGPPALLERIVELGLGAPPLRGRTLNLVESQLANRPHWLYGRLARAVALRTEGDDLRARRELEAVAGALRATDAPTAGWAHAAAARGAEGEARARALEAAVSLRPDDGAILGELAELLPGLGRAAAAVRAARRWARVAATASDRARALAAEARILRDHVGEAEQARSVLAEAMELAPADPEIQAEAASTALRLGDLDDAAARFRSLAERAESGGDRRAAGRWWSELARILGDRGAWDAALEALDRARTRDPDDPRLLAQLLATARRAGRLAWGRARFEGASVPERGPAAAALLREAALVWRDEDPARSAALLAAARRADPDDLTVLEAQLELPVEVSAQPARIAAELAEGRRAAADDSGALAAIHRSLDAAGPRPDPDLLRSLDRTLAALEHRRPESPEVARARLRWARATDDPSAARAAASELVRRLEPGVERSELLLDLGRVHEEAGRFEAALEAYEDAGHSVEARARAAEAHAALLLNRGDPDAARAAIDRALDERAPEDERRRLLLRRAEAWTATGRPDAGFPDARAALDGRAPTPDHLRGAEVALAADQPEAAERWARGVAELPGADEVTRDRALELQLRALDAAGSPDDRTPVLHALLTRAAPGSARARRLRARLRAALEAAARFGSLHDLEREAAELPGLTPSDRAQRWLAAAEVAHRRLDDAEAAWADLERVFDAGISAVDRGLARAASRLGLEVADALNDADKRQAARARLLELEAPETREQVRLEHAETLLDAGRTDEALEVLETAAVEATASVAPAARLAEIARDRGDLPMSARWFDQAARRAERGGRIAEAARLHAETAQRYAEMGDEVRAVHHDRAVLALREAPPDLELESLGRLVEQAREEGDHATVADLLERAAAIAPDPSPLHLERGLALAHGLDDPDAAIDAWWTTWQTGAAGPAIAEELSRLLQARGRHRERLALERSRAEASPDAPAAAHAWLRAARIAHQELDDAEAALAHVERAIRLDPDLPPARRLRLELLRESGSPVDVAEALAHEAQSAASGSRAAELWLQAAEKVAEPRPGADEIEIDALRRAHAYAASAARADPAHRGAVVAEARWARAAGLDAGPALAAAAARADAPAERWAARWAAYRIRSESPLSSAALEALAGDVALRRGLDDGEAAAALGALGFDPAEAAWPVVLDAAVEASAAAEAWPMHVEWLGERAGATDDPPLAARLHHRRAQVLHENLARPGAALEALEAARAAADEADPVRAAIDEDHERLLAESGQFARLADELGRDALEARWSAWHATGDPRARAAARALWPRYPEGSQRRAALLWDVAEDPGEEGLAALHQLVVDGPDAARRRASFQLEARYEAASQPARVLEVLRERAATEVDDVFRARTCARIAGVLQWGLEDAEGAEDEFRAALALDSTCEPARRGLALLLEDQERYEAILADLGADTLRGLRDDMLRRHEAQRAVSATDVLVAAEPATAADEWMTVARGLSARPEARASAWARAARAGAAEAIDALRRTFEAVGDDDPDRVRLAELLAGLVPEAERPRYLLAQARAMEPHAALELLGEAASLAPDDPEVAAALARALGEAKHWDLLADAFGPEALAPWAAEARADEDDGRRETFLRRFAEAAADADEAAARWFELGASAERRGDADEAWSALSRGVAATDPGSAPPAGGLDLLGRLGRRATVAAGPSAFALATGSPWPAATVSTWLDAIGPGVADALDRAEGELLLRAALATGTAADAADIARDEDEAEALARRLARGAADDRWAPAERVRATLAWLERAPNDPQLAVRLEAALALAAAEAPETQGEIREAWIRHRVQGDAATRLAAVRRLIAATDGIRDPELLSLEMAAALELGDWEGAEYAADALLDSDATPGDVRRVAARSVVAAPGAPPRLLERAWVELARPETARDDREQLEALLALAEAIEARGGPATEIAGPLEISLGLALEEDEEVRLRRRLVVLFDKAGDWPRAERHQRAVAEKTRSADDHRALAELRAWLDDPDGARAAAERALELDPGLDAAHQLRLRLGAEGDPEARLQALAARARHARIDAPTRAHAWVRAIRAAAPNDPDRAHAWLQEATEALPETEALDPLWRELASGPPPGLGPEVVDEVAMAALARWGPSAPAELRLELHSRLLRRADLAAGLDVLEPALRRARREDDPVVGAWRSGLDELPEPERERRVARLLEQLDEGPVRAWLRAELGGEPPAAAAELDDAQRAELAAADAEARRGRLERALELIGALPDDAPEVVERRVEWLFRAGRTEEAEAVVTRAESRSSPADAAGPWLRALRWRWVRTRDAQAPASAVERQFDGLPLERRAEALHLLVDVGALETAVRLADRSAEEATRAEIAAVASSAELRRGRLDDAIARAEAANLAPELARLYAQSDDPKGLLRAIERLPPPTSLAERLDRAWTAVFLRMDRLGEPCADQLHAVREAVESADDDDLASEVPLVRDLAARAERLGRPDDARALRERLAPFDPEGRAALLEAWSAAGRYEAVARHFEANAPSTHADHEAFVRALVAMGRAEEALPWAKRLLDADAPSTDDAARRAARLALGARVALEAGEVVLGLDWGRLAAWLRPGSFDPAGYEAAIESGPPTPEKIEHLVRQIEAGRAGRAPLDELRRALDALPDARWSAVLEAERALLGEDLDVEAMVARLDRGGATRSADRLLQRVFEDDHRPVPQRTRALALRLARSSTEEHSQEILQLSQYALRAGLDDGGMLRVALEAARRSGLPNVELELLREHGRGLEAASRIAVLCREDAPLEAARSLSRALDEAPAELHRTIVAHATPLLRRLRRPDAEADLWARLAAAREGAARASALSRLAVVRAKELDDRRGALAAWRAAVQASPEDLDLRRGAARAAVALGELREARNHAEEAARWAVRLDQTDAAVAFLLEAVELAARTRDADAEMAIWRSLVRLRPEAAVVIESLVARARRAGGGAYLDLLNGRISELEPGLARGRLRVAAARLLEHPLGRGQEAEALRELADREDLHGEERESGTDLLAEPPAPEWATADLGVSRSELRLAGRFDQWAALEAARAEGTAEPQLQARLWVEVARIHRERSEPDADAIRTALGRAVAHHPLHAPALEAMLRFEVAEGRWIEARRTLERLERIGGPGWPAGELELMAGRILTEVDEPELAAERYRRAAVRDPDGLAPRRALAELDGRIEDLRALRARLDPTLDREELARVELSTARRELAAGDADGAASSVERALEAAPELEGAWTLRRRITEAAGRDRETIREAIVREAEHVDHPNTWAEALAAMDRAGDANRAGRLLDALADREPSPELRPRVIEHLRARGRHREALELLEREGGFAAAPEPSAEELAEWAKAFDTGGRWADVFRVLAHARHHGLADAVLVGLGPYTEEAPSIPEVQRWLTERVTRLDSASLADPRVQAGLSLLAERQTTADIERARAEGGRAEPRRRYESLRRQLLEAPFDLGVLEAFAEVTTGERRAGALAVRRFLATGEAHLELGAPPTLERVARAFPRYPVESRADELGLATLDDLVEGALGARSGVAVLPALASGWAAELDQRRGEVTLGRAWYDHAREAERRSAAIHAVLRHLLGGDGELPPPPRADLDAAALWVARDVAATASALRRPTWRSLVEPMDDPRGRTDLLSRDRRLSTMLARCALGTLLDPAHPRAHQVDQPR